MKRICTLFAAIAMATSYCFASASSSLVTVPGSAAAPKEIGAPAPTTAPALPPAEPLVIRAADIKIPLGASGQTIGLDQLATMKAADLEKMTGKKMGFLRRMEFQLAQRKLRHSINADGTVSNKRLAMMASKEVDGETGFHIGGFALGFFLGLIGVLIAYLINDEKKRNRVKWSWIGLGVIVVIVILASI